MLSSDVGGGADGWSVEDPDPTRFDDELDGFTAAAIGGGLEADALDGDRRNEGDARARVAPEAPPPGQVMQGSAVNVDATSPGAALASG